MRDAQEYLFGWQPRYVELGLKKRAPAFADQVRGQRLSGQAGLLPVQGKAAVLGVELPQVARLGADLEHIAGVDLGGFPFCRPGGQRWGLQFRGRRSGAAGFCFEKSPKEYDGQHQADRHADNYRIKSARALKSVEGVNGLRFDPG